ncbi:SPOR domain-containing protein [Legionella sp.]|uniref:SPOR domain-containing protein n=1 Tax=Legionella sp. TaxID=459 RepID=UPI00321F6812
MARDYGRRRPVRQKSSAPKQLFWMLASFLSGYLAATVFDFTSLSSWVRTNILAHTNEKPAVKVAAKEPQVPKPKFEFYTLLAKDGSTPSPALRAVVPAQPKPVTQSAPAIGNAPITPIKQVGVPSKQPGAVAVVESKPVASASASKDTYQIQIASFKKRQDAEHMKAALTLKGFDISVVPVSQPQGTWFRVIVGPFGSRTAAEKAQLTLAQSEHIKGMIRKMDA